MQDELAPEHHEAPKTKYSSFPLERYSSFVLRFLNRLKVTGKSAHTITAYRNDLNFFGRFLKDTRSDPGSLSNAVVADWIHYLQTHGRTSASSVRRAQMSVRTFIHFLVESKVLYGSSFLSMKSPRQPKNHLHFIPEDQFQSLCRIFRSRAMAHDSKAIRDLALILVLGKAGLKASEAASLRWSDLHLPERGKASIIVRGKEKTRLVQVDQSVKAALNALRLEAKPELSATLSPEPHSASQQELASRLQNDHVFFGFQNVTRRLSTKSVQRHSIKFIIYEICQEHFGIPYHSESFRNHAIMLWFKAGMSLERVAELAGYSSLHSLERFLTSDSIPLQIRRKDPASRSELKNESKSATQADRQI